MRVQLIKATFDAGLQIEGGIQVGKTDDFIPFQRFDAICVEQD